MQKIQYTDNTEKSKMEKAEKMAATKKDTKEDAYTRSLCKEKTRK